MKRSEMVAVLEKMLNENLPEEYQFNADTFLCNLEVAYGMQPPPILDPTSHPESVFVNEWEPENE